MMLLLLLLMWAMGMYISAPGILLVLLSLLVNFLKRESRQLEGSPLAIVLQTESIKEVATSKALSLVVGMMVMDLDVRGTSYSYVRV